MEKAASIVSSDAAPLCKKNSDKDCLLWADSFHFWIEE